MNDMITTNVVYKTAKGTPVTDSLMISKVFGKQHKNVIRSIKGLAQNLADRNWFCETTYKDSQNKVQPLFLVTRDGFTLLAMGLTGEKALKFKISFIEQFDRMENEVKSIAARQYASIPQSFSEALRLAAVQAETIEHQQSRLIEQEPKVLFANSVESSKESILVGELAKLLSQNGINTGEKRLFQWLRDNHFLCCAGERYNEPTQRAMELGLFELRKITINVGYATKVRTTTKVTGKGQIYFLNKFLYKKLKAGYEHI